MKVKSSFDGPYFTKQLLDTRTKAHPKIEINIKVLLLTKV